jgi:hemolysin type calcium-binding protein
MQESQLKGGERPLRRRGRWLCLAAGLLAGFLGVSAQSSGATTYPLGLALVDEPDSTKTLSYGASPGQANKVTVTLAADTYTVTDSAGLPAGAGCTQLDANTASCPATSVATVRVDVGDLDDTVSVLAPTRALLYGTEGADNLTGGSGPDVLDGGLGDDTINARDGGNDSVICGAGAADLAVVDPQDSASPADCEQLDTPPDTAIEAGPPPATSDRTPAFYFAAVENGPITSISFECRIIDSNPATIEDFTPCDSPHSPSRPLADGSYTFEVRARDAYGSDPSSAILAFQIDTVPPLPSRLPTRSAGGLPPGLVIIRPPGSFVLIAGRTIKVSRGRVATVRLNCSGNRDCAGELSLTTANRIRLSGNRRRFVKLGGARFSIPAPRSVIVRVPLTKRKYRIVKRLRRLKTMVTVMDRDRVGRTRISSREVVLKSP